MKLVFSPEADQDVDKIDAWWRENRLDAPRLFVEELTGRSLKAEACDCRSLTRTDVLIVWSCSAN